MSSRSRWTPVPVALIGVAVLAPVAIPRVERPGPAVAAWAAMPSVKQGPPISRQAEVVLSLPIGTRGQATDFVLIREAARNVRGQQTYFFIPPVVQSDKVEIAGYATQADRLSASIELLPVFPQKAREVYLDAFSRDGNPEIWPATLEYVRVSVPALQFSRTYRQGRARLPTVGIPFRFEIELPGAARELVDGLSRALDARNLIVDLDFGWGAFVEKQRSVRATGFDLYTTARPLGTLKSGLRVFDRRGLEAAATTLVKTKLAGVLELEVVGEVHLTPGWEELIRQVFVPVAPADLMRLGAGRESLAWPDDLLVPRAAVRGSADWERDLYRDQRAFALGTLTYRDTEFSVSQRLKVGWTVLGQADLALNRWQPRSQERHDVRLTAPAHCRTPLTLATGVQPGERVRVVVERLEQPGTPPGGATLPVQLVVGGRTRTLAGRETTLIATEPADAAVRLETAECERSGVALAATLAVEVAR